MKIVRREKGYDQSAPEVDPDHNLLCLEDESGRAVAIVELSVQPLNPQRNPPPFPIPLFIKEAYCEAQDLPPPNGWISNLLVDEACRGRGYSKAIMLATEGIARKWGCTSISLHVDPDSSTGRVPQRLYERLGYKPVVVETDQKFLWMGPDVIRSGLYMVDGLPLLFLRKELL
jgi:GNAT superfamily N-acetyltransferase